MSKREKLLNRLSCALRTHASNQQRPKDFTWEELTTLLGRLGYREVTSKTGGSRRRFIHDNAPPIFLHKPHPGNTLKRYVINDVLAALKEGGFI